MEGRERIWVWGDEGADFDREGTEEGSNKRWEKERKAFEALEVSPVPPVLSLAVLSS